METIFNEIIPFYSTLEWMNKRQNGKNKMILGATKLEYVPFNSKMNEVGLDVIINSLRKNSINLINFKRK
jgi:hypothetical protein